jgi:hypothetical protein
MDGEFTGNELTIDSNKGAAVTATTRIRFRCEGNVIVLNNNEVLIISSFYFYRLTLSRVIVLCERKLQ